MEKEIRIKFEQILKEDGSFSINTELETIGQVTPYELLGILRYLEKDIWMKLATGNQKSLKKSKKD